jgi:hypothetical protein
MSDNSVPGSGAGQGRRDPEHPAGTGGPAGRHPDVMSHRRLAWSIWAGTGTIIVTATAGLINYEFGHGILLGVLTFVIAVSVGTITGLIIYYAPGPHRHIRSARHAAEGMTGDNRPAGGAAGDGGTPEPATVASQGRGLIWSVRAAGLGLAGLAALVGISYGVGREFARGALPGLVSTLIAVAVVVAVRPLWQLLRPWSRRLRQLRPDWPLRPRRRHGHDGAAAISEPDGAKGRSLYPSARVVMACVLMTAAVITGAELGLTVRAAACPAPVELRVLTSQEDLAAIQAAIPAFEQAEPRYVGSPCFAVQLTAYAPYDAPDAMQMATAFDSGWNSDALSSIGPEPDIWIPDSTAEVDAVRSTLTSGGPALGQPRSIGYSPVVVAIPDQLVAADSLDGLEQGQSWSTLYTDFTHLGIRLALPNPGLSETGLFEIAALYGAIGPSARRHIEASGNFPLDSQSLLCEASQAKGQRGEAAHTAYLVSEAAMADYNYSIHDPAEDVCPTPGTVQPLRAFYPTGTATLDFPFTTVNWGGNQDQQRRRYEDDFYHYLTDPAGGSVLAGQGLRSPDCGTEGTIATQYGIAEFDSSCENPQTPSAATTTSALNDFNHALPNANILIGIDDSGPMKPDLAQVTSAVEAVFGQSNPPVGSGDHFGIWELPGSGGTTHAPLVNFEPVTPANLHQVGEQLTGITAHSHSADYDMLIGAAHHVLYAQPPVLPGAGTPPVDSVVLLTDGDGYSGHDPDGGTPAQVQTLFTSPPFGESRIALYIIAFGPAGCTPTFLNLAEATHGGCYPADGGDPRQLLQQALDQITGGE